MKRDMDVIRAIALKAVESDGPIFGLDGVPSAVFVEHVALMQEAGLVDARFNGPVSRASTAAVLRLTWDGQNFADEIANDTIWRKAKETVIKPGASWTFAVLREVVKTLVVQQFRADGG